MNNLMIEISSGVLLGDFQKVEENVRQALDNNIQVKDILNEGLILGMKEVGRLYEENEYFIPEMLVAARAMQRGMDMLRPLLAETDIKPVGKIVLGTVKGDLHDIGKNLVGMMFEGAGFEVVDLGVDVSAKEFADAVRDSNADVVALSALLTTTMKNMKEVIEIFKDKSTQTKVKVIVGGAPITEEFAAEIGADGYAPDASKAARLVSQWLE